MYTREQLNMMPLLQLRGMDIKDKEEELLIQEVINEKMQNEPGLDPNRPVLTSSQTDRMTPEKEAILQAELDGKPIGEVTEIEIPDEEIRSDAPIDVPPKESVVETKKPFCLYCDSKGVRHKKNCTRLSANK